MLYLSSFHGFEVDGGYNSYDMDFLLRQSASVHIVFACQTLNIWAKLIDIF